MQRPTQAVLADQVGQIATCSTFVDCQVRRTRCLLSALDDGNITGRSNEHLREGEDTGFDILIAGVNVIHINHTMFRR